MTQDYSTEAQAVADALNAVYENKQTNKKNSISGDFSSDNASYPTVKAVKTEFGSKVTSWSSTTSDSNYPSEKLVKGSLDDKISKSQTSGLVKNDGTIDTNTYLTATNITGKEDSNNKVTNWSSTVTDTHYPSEKLVKNSLDDKVNINQGSGNKNKNVVTDNSGNITLEAKPTIPTKTSDLTNDGSDSSDSLVFIETSATSGLVKNDGTIDTNSYLTSSNITGKEDTSNKATTFTSKTDDTHYPTTKLVKDSLDDKISKSSTTGLIKNDGTVDTTTYLSSLPSHSHGSITNEGKIGSTSGLPLITGTGGLIGVGAFGSTSGTFAEGNHTHSQYLTSHQSLSDIGGVVTVEKQTTAETGYTATYVVKQNGSQVGSKINIPKDFLVKSGSVKTVASADLTTLGNGYSVGDKYIDFVINTKDNTGTDEHIYINVKDLVEDTTYSADNSTLQLSSTTFSIKNKGVTATQIADNTITATQIASKTITASEIADSVVAKSITQTDINNWNDMVTGGLTTSDVQSEISAFASALAEAINPST